MFSLIPMLSLCLLLALPFGTIAWDAPAAKSDAAHKFGRLNLFLIQTQIAIWHVLTLQFLSVQLSIQMYRHLFYHHLFFDYHLLYPSCSLLYNLFIICWIIPTSSRPSL